MKYIILTSILLCNISTTIFAQQSQKKLDIYAIKSMVGCFDVEFKYTETFAPEIDYEQAYDYTSAAFEWAELVEATEDKIVIQHLLIINDSTIIKHWRQDWIYESAEQFSYDKNNTWKFDSINNETSKGKWTQNVYQVDDSPRYSGTATWTHVDGRSSFYTKVDSPLPRREYSKREDYNVMKRGNRVQITDFGWVHEQDNDKIVRTDSTDQLLVQEKGYNTYKKRANSDCEAARDWWKKNKNMWKNVRQVWDQCYAKNKHLELALKIEDKRLYEHLFYNDQEWNKSNISDLINQYIVKKHK